MHDSEALLQTVRAKVDTLLKEIEATEGRYETRITAVACELEGLFGGCDKAESYFRKACESGYLPYVCDVTGRVRRLDFMPIEGGSSP